MKLKLGHFIEPDVGLPSGKVVREFSSVTDALKVFCRLRLVRKVDVVADLWFRQILFTRLRSATRCHGENYWCLLCGMLRQIQRSVVPDLLFILSASMGAPAMTAVSAVSA